MMPTDETEVIRQFGLPPRVGDLPVIRAQLAEMARLELTVLATRSS
jgi:hypothetical protein